MRAAKIVLAFTLFIVLAAAIGAWVFLRTSLPKIDGEVAVSGLSAALTLVRDREGVPHIFAATERDGWFGMGYAHAQDRLWQMEFQRRVGAGRLAEILGERAFDTDRLMRTLGIARTAERIAARLDPQTRAHLEAYCAGVNAYLAGGQTLPVEFHALRVKPEPWKPADTVSWLLVMAWDLSGNWRSELGRLRFAAKLGPERTNEFLPAYPGDPSVPLPDFKALYAQLSPMAGAMLAVSPGAEEAVGSNSWVVDGARTVSGKPLLANDPHLGLQAPALWYLAHVSTPQGNVVGGTLPGVPFVVLGRNDRIAWSMTTTNGDTQDLFVERVAPDDENSYLTPTGKARFEVREEVIRVGGAERRIQVRSTRHGPVISDVVASAAKNAPKGYVFALAWAALSEENATARAGLAMNRARNADALIAAARDFHAPQQNLVYADSEGRIGFVAPALVPRRHPDNAAMGRIPVPGWEAKYDWQGFLAFEELPATRDGGTIVTANHKVTPPGYPHFITSDWFPPYRAERIEELLAAHAKHSRETFARMQADNESRLARELLPVLRSAKPGTEGGQRALQALQGWKGRMTTGSPEALAFAAWYRELTRLVYSDELGELFPEVWELRAQFMIAVMKDEGGLGRWCDDVRTPAAESCVAMASQALDLAARDLDARYGDAAKWRWGAAHVAAGSHRPFGFFPVVSRLFNVEPETAGDTYTVNVGHFTVRDEDRPFANRHAPSLRAIYDFEDLDKSFFMQSTGQSGNVMSPWYASFAERWAKVEYITIPTKRDKIEARHTLTLRP